MAFTLPSMAGTTADRAARAPQATGGVAPQLLAAMKRDLGAEHGDQAAARVQAGGVGQRRRRPSCARRSGDSYARLLARPRTAPR